MNNEKRLFLAIGLSVLVILGYQAYMKKHVKPYHPQKTHDTVMLAEQGTSVKEPLISMPKEQIKEQLDDKAVPDNTVTINNDVFTAVLTDHGAAIKELYLLKYIDTKDSPTLLFSPSSGIPYLLSTDEENIKQRREWSVISKDSARVQYKSSADGIEITKTFSFYNNKYIIGLEVEVHNISNYTKNITYTINGGAAAADSGYLDSRYIGADVLTGDKILRKRPSGKTITDGILVAGSPAWISTHDRYFSFVLKPEQQAEGVFIRSSAKNNIWAGVISGPIALSPGQTITQNYMQYAGPSDAEAISEMGPTVNNVISYGFFHAVAKVLFKGLRLLYRVTGNYGVAIILLSLCISLIMMPLTKKSLHSMKSMQRIQPETEQIRKAYSDNPQKMNKEIMELYKKHKINPVGGCLPMLLQLPIFMSLYQVLLRSVALRGAHFLWIKNLAGPDAAFTIPYKLPIIGNHINILPILMAIAMWAQQKMSQGGGKEVSEQQKMMSTIMPVMFGFIFYNMPSGLVLYWFTNTLFMLLIQEVVLKSRKAVAIQ